uniref:Uncharacterized protein LOC104221344 isoform X1 n=1 Tax=Nicotiana sylvestris TaxID=4096 RepID=A0A1U7W8W3_NICSY|nr:PREDICTED: uncharacterized protein LOC104221344 isoform X1 [Nicotiana sylvestris]
MKLEPSMEQSAFGSSRKPDEAEFNLREWALKAKLSREKTNSRRYSASYIGSFRENAKSFRSNVIISSTASSPGYTLREEIDPSKYSFTTALKALQAKTLYSWEYMSPDGLALNSKWNEAEKYICNPLSGEVPLECLSTKTLTERSFRQSNSRITVSGPLIYPSHIQSTGQFQTKYPAKPSFPTHDVENQIPSKVLEKKDVSITRDMGTQSIAAYNYVSSNSPSPVPTPSIEEMSIKLSEAADSSPMSMTTPSIKEGSIKLSEADDHSPMTIPQLKSEEEMYVQVEGKETAGSREQDTKSNEEQLLQGQRKKVKQMDSRQFGGCLSWMSLWMRRKRRLREKHKSRSNNIFLCHINACYKE